MLNVQLTSVPGAKANFYVTGTTTRLAVYQDAGLTTPHANPVVADSEGLFPDIWFQARIYKMVLTESDDTVLYTEDPLYKGLAYAAETALPGTAFPGLIIDNTTDGRRYQRNIANSAWIDLGPSSGAGNIASVSEVLTGTDNAKTVTPAGLAAIWSKGADVTLTNTTLTLPSTGGGFFAVAGAFNIATINSATNGREVWIYHTVARTLTYSVNFTTLTGVDTAVRAGDMTLHIRDGTAWRMAAHATTKDNGVSAKTTAYTVTVNENGKTLPFTVSSNQTLSLPAAASAGNGFRVTVVNRHASTAKVTIDADGSELVDGIATRVLNPGDRVTIVCDGTGWITESGTPYRFISADQTITPGGTLTLAHGLAKAPQKFTVQLVCQTSEHGYTAGQIRNTVVGQFASATDNSLGVEIVADATNLNCRYGSNVPAFTAQNFGTGTFTGLTDGNWKLRVIAEE